jgi:MFS family permease
MAPWFSATVVARAMATDWGVRDGTIRWLTLAVQLGFVIGSLVSAALLLSDRWSPRRLAILASGVAAVLTAALAHPAVGPASAIGLRLLVGIALAGVYPPAIKIAAGWTRDRRGRAIGMLVGGISLGSAVPHLLPLVAATDDWRIVQWWAAGSAGLATLVFARFVREGPWQAPSAPFDPRALRAVLSNRQVMLATGGYLGHMWELYAMWSSIGAFWSATVLARGGSPAGASVLSFLTVATGALGCWWAGVAADRVGRSLVTIVAMAISGSCSVLVGLLAGWSWPAVVVVALLWGASIVADSAQFSASVTEWADPAYVGTAVTVQTAAGFLLTMVTIGLVPQWSQAWGWRFAYLPLALGPLCGILCMLRVRAAEGRRLRERTRS